MDHMVNTRMSVYIKAEIEEMFGPDNMYFAGLALGHGPTKNEAVWHYINNGGPADFRRRWEQTHKLVAQKAVL